MPDSAPEPLSAEQMIAVEGAKRLLSDQIFHDVLNVLVADATQRAIISPDAGEREESRQMVLAIGRIKGTLEQVVEHVNAVKATAQQEKAFE